MNLVPQDFVIPRLGPAQVTSPVSLSSIPHDGLGHFIPPGVRVPYKIEMADHQPHLYELAFEKAGPREKIFFDPQKTTAAIVTCGGLCPGLNNVIRSIYLELRHNYQVPRIWGIRNGFMGLNPAAGKPPVRLTDESVEEIHKLGGTVLGVSRGPQEVSVMVDFLVEEQIDILFCVGGDGTQRGAHAIAQEIGRRGLAISIIGIPKTIDNDIPFVYRTFGYLTAVEKAQEVLRGAHVEARGAVNGIGLVKLMGREAGFIAAGATMASQEVNYCLIPEIDFPLEGEDGLLRHLEQRMRDREHALIVVAEGAGQHLMDHVPTRDASGNVKFADIGKFLKQRISAHFDALGNPVNLKYIDPSYYIRSVPANTVDRLMSDSMARNAVHTAMSGATDTLIGLWHGVYINVPICTAVDRKRHLQPNSGLWQSVLLATGQPRWPDGWKRECSKVAPNS